MVRIEKGKSFLSITTRVFIDKPPIDKADAPPTIRPRRVTSALGRLQCFIVRLFARVAMGRGAYLDKIAFVGKPCVRPLC